MQMILSCARHTATAVCAAAVDVNVDYRMLIKPMQNIICILRQT